ncbi:MAG: hypothetical protein MRZ79_17365, partial [Bacteroidia bacterium]|nr:hypothetical protein [Bacteroidia bacterium]
MRKFYVLICIVLSPILLLSQNQLGANFLGDTFEDLLGTSVAISNDGSRIAMGGRGNSTQFGRSGIVKVMDWNGSAWVQAGSSIYGDSIGHEIGHQVALSGDGNVLILSSIRARGSFRFGDGFIQAYQWNGTSWNSMGSRIYGSNLEGFGFSISLSDDGTRLAVSSVSNSQIFGKVKVYEWNGTAWNQIGTTITGLNSGDWMGYDVSLSGDGQRLAVGTPNILVGSGQGAVDVYEWNLGVWNQLGSSLNLNGGGFEIATSLSYDGSTLAVGNAINPGNGNSGGIAKTYQWNGSSWVQRGNSLFGDRSQDSYGYQVSISGNGERLVVSALNHDLDPLNFIFETGQVKIYDWNGFGWQNIGNDIQGQVRHDSLGFALAVSGSGNRLIAGAPSHDHFNMQQARGMVKVFNLGAYVQRGIVRLDANNNCQADSNENVLSNVWIEIEKSNERRRVSTNSLGEYAAFVDTGSYVIKVDSRNYPYAYACPDSHLVQIDSQTTSLPNLDFVLEDSISCPYLTVDLTTPFIRRCFSSYYLIEYCNHGSEDLPSAVIEMELDPNFIFLGTNANLLNQNGQMLEFGVDSIKAGECKSIRVDFRENCLSLFGQVHCSSAHIYPDSLCVGSIPNVQLENFCLQDSLVIKLKNLADSFPNPLKYLIAESGLIIDSGNVSLGTNDSIFIYISNPDSSLAYQFILAPDDMRYYHASALLSCGPRPSSLQIAYPSRSMQAFSDIDCQNNLGSYDPNDKAAIPPAGDIPPDVPLAYTIRFQNTGTDTAFFINILDTLSQNLDVNTLEVQSASHPYEYEVLAQNPAVVRFRFDPIFLPDSTTDLEGSNGFVKFG